MATAFQNRGLANQHMEKFGVKVTPFSPSMIEAREISIDSDEALELLQVLTLGFYNAAPGYTYRYPLGDQSMAAAEASFVFYFRGTPRTEWFAIAPIFQAYNAGNNKYGGFTAVGAPDTDANDVNIMRMAFSGTSWTGGTIDSVSSTLTLIPQTWVQNAEFEMNIVGTNLTTVRFAPEDCPLLQEGDIRYNTRTPTQGDMEEWLKEVFIQHTF
jgi:hypothetical protein